MMKTCVDDHDNRYIDKKTTTKCMYKKEIDSFFSSFSNLLQKQKKKEKKLKNHHGLSSSSWSLHSGTFDSNIFVYKCVTFFFWCFFLLVKKKIILFYLILVTFFFFVFNRSTTFFTMKAISHIFKWRKLLQINNNRSKTKLK